MGKALAPPRRNSWQRWQLKDGKQQLGSFKTTDICSSLITENWHTSELETLKEQNKVLQDTITELESTKVTMENELCDVQENQSLQEGICKQNEIEREVWLH